MATKTYSKHKEFKEFSSRSTKPYGSDEQFDMIKSELLPKTSKLGSLAPAGGSDSEYHYEYHEDRHPSGQYERKDLHTVEQYTIPAKSSAEQSSYYYSREDKTPAITSSSHHEHSSTTASPGYSRMKSSRKEMSQNVEELDSLLDDLQRDQERQLYKSGYTSDTAESSSFDYRKTSTPVKSSAPSSGYSTLKTERHDNWTASPLAAPAPLTQSEFKKEFFREEKTESRVVPSQISPAIAQPVPAPVCHQCQFPSSTLTRSGGPMNKVTTTVKTYSYEVPADEPVPVTTEMSRRYLHSDTRENTTTLAVPASPALGCQYCSHCHTRITQHSSHSSPAPPPPASTTLREHRVETETSHTDGYPRGERMLYPAPVNEVRTPVNYSEPTTNGHGPNGPTTYKWSETSYSAYNTTERRPVDGAPPSPFPRPHTPAALDQPPKKLDELMAEFPEARFPTQPDGLTQRKVDVVHEKKQESSKPSSRNVAGPAVYYPPGHTPFQKKEAAYSYGQASAEGGKWAAGRGMYEYEAGSKSKEKSSESKKVVPVCLPLCCAMPCSIM